MTDFCFGKSLNSGGGGGGIYRGMDLIFSYFSTQTAICHISMVGIFRGDFSRRFFVFIQLLILIYRLLQHQPHQPPPQSPSPARQAPKRRHNMCLRPWIMQREDKAAYHNLLNELYNTDNPGFTNLMRMTPEFFEMIKARVEPRLAKQATTYKSQLSVGMKLAITLRDPVFQSFISKVCRTVQEEFKGECLRCPSISDD